jgi:hypothetical protein
MDLNTIKEEFSYAYVKMIAAVTGYEVIVTGRPSDSAGIDITIRAPGNINGVFSPTIDAQVKCTSRDVLKKHYLKFPLEVKNYKRLISSFSQAPQILIIVLFPDDLNDVLKITSAYSLVDRCAYWISLKGRNDTTNDETITIDIPLDNILLPETLKHIMETHVDRLKRLFKLEEFNDNLQTDKG